MGIWEHEGNVENTSRRRVFSTFLELIYRFYTRNTINTLFYVLYSDKTKVFDQSEREQESDKTWVFDRSECAQGPIYIIKADKPRGMLGEHKKNL